MATLKQKKAIDILVENRGMPIGTAMIEAGYNAVSAKNPKNLTDSKAFKEILDEYLSEEELSKKHKELLNASRLEHMVFPPFRTRDEDMEDGEDSEENVGEDFGEQLTDQEIRDLLASTNCTVRKIVHGDMQRHVYFWAADNKARKDAIDMGYKLRGAYAPDRSVNINASIDLTGEEPTDALALEYEEKLRKMMLNGGTKETPHLDERGEKSA